jgi:signal transduction histidine kinase
LLPRILEYENFATRLFTPRVGWLAIEPPNLEQAAASIERILRDGRAADGTMQHIRALFKRESFEKNKQAFPKLISQAVQLIQEAPERRDISIEYQFESVLPKVLVDPIQIQEVFINLISNAVESMEVASRSPYLQIRASAYNDDEVLAQMIDNGPGLEDFEKIFDAFVTTKENGTGIGLAVSRSIVEAHGGQLWAENNPEGGARFCLCLPRSTMSDAFANFLV